MRKIVWNLFAQFNIFRVPHKKTNLCFHLTDPQLTPRSLILGARATNHRSGRTTRKSTGKAMELGRTRSTARGVGAVVAASRWHTGEKTAGCGGARRWRRRGEGREAGRSRRGASGRRGGCWRTVRRRRSSRWVCSSREIWDLDETLPCVEAFLIWRDQKDYFVSRTISSWRWR
jgi:hypothetical protein